MVSDKLKYGSLGIRVPKNCWYAIQESRLIQPTRIYPIVRFGINLILWRSTEGKLICMLDRCPHRGSALSLGKICGNSLRCAYHGIEYNPEGNCTRIPSHAENAPLPKGLRISTFTTREAHGLIWLWWGDPIARESLPEIPWFDEVPEKNFEQTRTIVYPVSFLRLMESNFDGYHSEYIHGLNRGKLVTNTQCKVLGKLIQTQWENRPDANTPGVTTFLDVLFPSLMIARVPKWKTTGIFTAAPIHDSSTWISARYFGDAFATPVLGRIKNWIFMQYALKWVFRQDVRIQKKQTPEDCGMGFDHPVVNADQGILAYWTLLKESYDREDRKRPLEVKDSPHHRRDIFDDSFLGS